MRKATLIKLIPVFILLLAWINGDCQRVISTTYFCSFCHKGPYTTYEAARAHTCAVHNYLCNSVPVVPQGPSPQEIKKQREEKDLREASEDANDKGIDCYNKKDWDCAMKWFKESLDYNPDSEDAQFNLQAAEQQKELQQAVIKKQKEDADKKAKEEADKKAKEEEDRRQAEAKKRIEVEKTISVKNTSAEAISNQKNTKEGLATRNAEIMKANSAKVFDTKGDNRGAIADVKVKVAITPAQEKAAREYLSKNDKDYQGRQVKIKETQQEVAKFKKKDDELSKTIDEYKKIYIGKTAPKEEFDKYTKAIQEQQTVKGQLWNAQSTEKTLKQKDEEAIKKYVTFGEKKIPGQ